jgi:GNAT superfamily N-acetyltransferase
MASIALVAADGAADADLVAQLTDLVNRVYATAEEGLWVDGSTRTTPPEMTQLIAAGEIALARVDGDLVGSVRIQQLDSSQGEFGMLVADPDRRGEGIGRDLVRFAEGLTRQRGRTLMQLELLVPREWTHPTKEFLNAWYTRISYRPVHRAHRRELPPAGTSAGHTLRLRDLPQGPGPARRRVMS